MRSVQQTQWIDLCRATPHQVEAWVQMRGSIARSATWIAAGAALYGLSMGVWRDPLLGLYVAIKLPLLMGSTALVTALINGLLAQILGLRFPIAASLSAVLASFGLVALILAALAPLVLFITWCVPGVEAPTRIGHDILGLTHVAALAFAGVVANVRLHQSLRAWAGKASRGILIAWLATNLFVGAQLSWNLRPFFGDPSQPVQFLRADAFDGNFYESVWSMFQGVIDPRERKRHERPRATDPTDPTDDEPGRR